MKRFITVCSFFFLGLLFSGCPGDISYTYKTIKSVRVLIFSFQENGIYPYLDYFNREELGIIVSADSLSESFEPPQEFSPVSNVYAMEPKYQDIFTNSIDSINVYTLFDFDDGHPAGAKINDILLSLDMMGNTREVDINSLSGQDHHFKFSAIPTKDTLQFEITGVITNERVFSIKTELVILD